MTQDASAHWIVWNPSPVAFHIPFIDYPIAWYGLFFALGFILGYLCIAYLLTQDFAKTLPKKDAKKKAFKTADILLWHVVIGTLVGARLGHVFFYALPFYLNDPLAIFYVWQGGLASHGGAIGVIIALYLFQKKHSGSFLYWLDRLAMPTALAAVCIRIGNFFNQELVGNPTHAFFAVHFLNPFDGSASVPRHPVQLYEAIAYLCIFILLWCAWYVKQDRLKTGSLFALFLTSTFGARFFLEFFKAPVHSQMIDESILSAGQLLSIPFIFLGLLIFWMVRKQKRLGY